MRWTQAAYIKAFDFASLAHAGQQVPGTTLPYNVHLAKVAMEVMAAIQAEPEIDGDFALQCAILHDVLEDTAVDFEILKGKFGLAVANGVAALTKNSEIPKADRMADSLARILKQPKEIALVKLADRITNLAPPPSFWTSEKRSAYFEEAKKIYAALHPASNFLALRFQERLTAYQAWI